ncbi:MAG TPA: nuclear transport factor 2 family protein [Pyrinomonadaceae bacterium]
MTKPLIAVAALAVALFSAPPARAQAPEHLKMKGMSEQQRWVVEIERLQREIMDAIRDRDAKALERILSDDFVYRSPEGEVNRADFIKNVNALPGRIVSVEGKDLRVRIFGETAVMTGAQVAVLRTDDGKELESVAAFTDIFVRRRGRWLLALAHGVELPAPPAKQQ